MRGEYHDVGVSEEKLRELPPRARRIPELIVDEIVSIGTTSACAENTPKMRERVRLWRNYLRVRGEYHTPNHPQMVGWELPPRARRIRPSGIDRWGGDGTTSACAENTRQKEYRIANPRNYLRVRGEYGGFTKVQPGQMELPPRARRILSIIWKMFLTNGTTSACAENTIAAAALFV